MSLRWCEQPLVESAALDPYLRWAELSDWRAVTRHRGEADAETRLRFIASAPAARFSAICAEKAWRIPALYTAAPPAQGEPEMYFTGEIELAKLAWLKSCPHEISWELAVPFRSAALRAAAIPTGLRGVTRDAKAFASTAPLPQLQARKKRNAKPTGCMAVIDFGCPFLNQRFEDDVGGSRIAALWDQDNKPGALWVAAGQRRSGREIDRRSIDSLLRLVRSPGQAWDEALVYRHHEHLIDYDDPRRRLWGHTHGAHVLDLAGGRDDPLTGDVDAAAAADLLFVQLPALTASDASGCSLAAQLLDGVRWCMQRVPADQPLVINISYGGHAGPHNGSALLERAFDALLRERPENFAIVMGAGNAAQAEGHAHRWVSSTYSGLFGIELAAQDGTDSFVEFWYRAPEQGRVSARVRAPQGAWSEWIGVNQARLLRDGAQQALALARHSAHQPNGKGNLLLLALAPTAKASDSDEPIAPAGLWEVEWRLEAAPADAQFRVDAWVERDEAGAYAELPPTRLLGTDVADSVDCLSNIAGGRLTIAVGGLRRSDGQSPAYSSRSPRKASLAQRFVRAACEDSEELPGFTAAAVRSLESHRMNGTSVAAPVLARRLFNQMVRGKTDVDAALQAVVAAERGRAGGALVKE